MISNSERANAHSSLFVGEKDDVKMRFYRAALLANWPGKSWPAVTVALWLIENMRWEDGSVFRHTSVRHLQALTGLSRDGVDSGLSALTMARLIERTYLGKGRRGSIQVHQVVMAMPVGMLVTDLWQVACLTGHSGLPGGPVCQGAEWPAPRATSGLPGGPEWPAWQAKYPIPTIPQHIPASTPASLDVDRSRPEAEATPSNVSTTPTTIHSWPTKTLNQPGIARARVASATKDLRVVDAPSAYGYGTEIAGLNGHTSEVVDQLVALEGGIIVDKTPAWTVVLEAVRQTSPERVRAAILDILATQGAGKLRNRPMRVLKGFAAAMDQADAVAKLEAAKQAASKPRVSRLDMFGLRK